MLKKPGAVGLTDPTVLRKTEGQLAQASIIAQGKPTAVNSELIKPYTTVSATSNTVTTTTNTTTNTPGDTTTIYTAPGSVYVSSIDQTIRNINTYIESSGYSGASGYSGTIGASGISGFSGVSGASFVGSSGYSGYSGQVGNSGISGFSGATGATGESGYSGATGATGATGASGYSGATGATGATGESGYSGATGATGASGYSGATGATGESGYSGAIGISGYSGLSGFSGAGVGLDTVNVFTKNQSVSPVTLTPGATVAIDVSLSNNFKLTLDQSTTLLNPTNSTDGMVVNLLIKQDGTGGWTLDFGSKYSWPNATPPTISAGTNDVDFISMYYDGTSDLWRCVISQNFGLPV